MAQGVSHDPLPWGSYTLQRWGRPLAVVAALVFFISSMFPVVAGLSKNTDSIPKWWGTVDVGIALVLATLAFAIVALAGSKVTGRIEEVSYRAYRILIHGILVLNVMFFLFGDRIIWINCLTGFAWRTWLLLYVLPAWLTVKNYGGPQASQHN